MVDVDPLDADDRATLVALISKHRRETGSTVAARLLSDWEDEQNQFIKIMPRDYKRVLTAIRQAQQQGVPADDLIMAAARG
jgi:glutamate synthase (NADPH/NADH) large chain